MLLTFCLSQIRDWKCQHTLITLRWDKNFLRMFGNYERVDNLYSTLLRLIPSCFSFLLSFLCCLVCRWVDIFLVSDTWLSLIKETLWVIVQSFTTLPTSTSTRSTTLIVVVVTHKIHTRTVDSWTEDTFITNPDQRNLDQPAIAFQALNTKYTVMVKTYLLERDG